MTSEELMTEIIERTPSELNDLRRFMAYLTELGGVMPPDMRVRQLPLEQRAKHAARLWQDLTGTNVISRAKILCLCGHEPGTVGAADTFSQIVQVLSLREVTRAGRKNPAINWGTETLFRIGDIGALALYEDEDGKVAEERIRAYLLYYQPVKIRAKELAALINVRHDRRFGIIFASVVQTMAKDYDLKIFRYRYGLNNGAVRKLTNEERRPRLRATNQPKRTNEILAPHRFATESRVMIAPTAQLLANPALREIMYELTDRRPLHVIGRRYGSNTNRVTGSGPLGSENPKDREGFLRQIAAVAQPYPAEFAEWWSEVVVQSTAFDAPSPAGRKPRVRSHRADVSPARAAPPGVVEDTQGVFRDENGVKIARGLKWL